MFNSIGLGSRTYLNHNAANGYNNRDPLDRVIDEMSDKPETVSPAQPPSTFNLDRVIDELSRAPQNTDFAGDDGPVLDSDSSTDDFLDAPMDGNY